MSSIATDFKRYVETNLSGCKRPLRVVAVGETSAGKSTLWTNLSEGFNDPQSVKFEIAPGPKNVSFTKNYVTVHCDNNLIRLIDMPGMGIEDRDCRTWLTHRIAGGFQLADKKVPVPRSWLSRTWANICDFIVPEKRFFFGRKEDIPDVILLVLKCPPVFIENDHKTINTLQYLRELRNLQPPIPVIVVVTHIDKEGENSHQRESCVSQFLKGIDAPTNRIVKLHKTSNPTSDEHFEYEIEDLKKLIHKLSGFKIKQKG